MAEDFGDLTSSMQEIDEEVAKLQRKRNFIFKSLMYRMNRLTNHELHQIVNKGNSFEKDAARTVLAVMFGEDYFDEHY